MVGAQPRWPLVNIADLVNAEPGSGAAETVTINALDLLAGTVLLANGTHAISVPGLTTNLPLSGTGLTTSLSIIEKARTKCGKRGSQAETAQVALAIDGTLALVGERPGTAGHRHDLDPRDRRRRSRHAHRHHLRQRDLRRPER